MEPRRNSAGREYAAASSVWPSQQSRAVWWILDGKDDENRATSFTILRCLYIMLLIQFTGACE